MKVAEELSYDGRRRDNSYIRGWPVLHFFFTSLPPEGYKIIAVGMSA